MNDPQPVDAVVNGLVALENEQGFLKAGFLGFQKSGKSYTAVSLALGVREFLSLPGPIAFYDTESGAGYLADRVREATGQPLLGVRKRSFESLMQFAEACLASKVSVGIVDSITHPWRELCDSYLAQINQKRKQRNLYPLAKLEFQHWQDVKKIWSRWSDFYLNSPLHLIVCGRAGYEYEFETNDETNRKELIKSGVKMRVEGEFGFEPSLLIYMERDQEPDGKGGFRLTHTATILGDRFSVIDGQSQANPTFDFFKPHVALLKPGRHSQVDTAGATETGAGIDPSLDYAAEKNRQTILAEEIQGLIVSKIPGMTAEEKKQKVDLIYSVFHTRSWTRVESMPSDKLHEGLTALRIKLGVEVPAADPPIQRAVLRQSES